MALGRFNPNIQNLTEVRQALTRIYRLLFGGDSGADGGGGLADAKYIVQKADSGVPNAQSLGTLGTGIVKNTATAGVGVLSTGRVLTAEINDDAVTYAKMQNVSAASRLLGRGSAGGAGNVEELTLAGGLSMSGTVVSSVKGEHHLVFFSLADSVAIT